MLVAILQFQYGRCTEIYNADLRHGQRSVHGVTPGWIWSYNTVM